MEKNDWYKHINEIFVSMLPVLGIAYYLDDVYTWEIPGAFLFVGILFLLLLVHLCFYIRKHPASYAFLVAVIAIVVIYSWYHREWFGKNPEESEELARLALLLALCIGSYIASKQYVLRIVLAAALLIAAVILGCEERQISKFGTAAVGVYLILVFMEVCFSSSVRKRGKSREVVAYMLLPVYILGFVLVLVLPASKEHLQWKIARGLVSKVSQTVTDISDRIQISKNAGYGEFGIDMTGYSESGGVGGSIWESKREALSLSSNTLNRRMLYLAGNRKDTYHNNKWEDTLKEEQYPLTVKEDSMDTVELLYALYRYNGLSNEQQYIRKSVLHVAYDGVRTKSVFTMGKMSSILYSVNAKEREKSLLRNKLTGLAGNETEYDVEYYDMNLGSDVFGKFIDKEQNYAYEKSTDEEAFRAVLRRHQNVSYVAFPEELEKALSKRREFIYTNYTKMEEEGKERIGELTKQVVSGKQGSYDKLCAIEDYLHEFTYTKNPKPIKEGEDVVEQFLFNTHEGYCTYFASAMALMGRSIGIPTRYVQGYLVDADEKGWFYNTVEEKQAHAWVEAYIDGIGWIPFEPTTGYGEHSNVSFEPPKVVLPQNMEQENPYKTVEGIGEPLRKAKQGAERGILSVLAVIAVVILFLLVGVYIRICRNKKRYQNLSVTDRFMVEARRMLWLCHYLNYDREESETWEEFIKRIELQEQDKLPLLRNIADTYSRVRYHEEEVTEQELQEMEEHNRTMKQILKNRLTKRRYRVVCIRFELMAVRNTTVKMS